MVLGFFMNEIKDYIEFSYYLSGIVVAIVAIVALYQIRIAKQAIVIQSKRHALTLTAEQCNYFSTDIMRLANDLYKKRVEVKCSFFDLGKWTVDTEGEKIILNSSEDIAPDICEIENVVDEVVILLNSIESFSVYFISGVADEEKAYIYVSNSYINTVEQMMPMILFSNENLGHYSSIVELYIMWKNRKKHEVLTLKLNDVYDKIGKNVLKGKKTIGV